MKQNQNKKIILIIDSNYEDVTKAGYEYRKKHVYPQFKKNGFIMILAVGNKAKRWFVEKKLNEESIMYITGIGHGLADLYTGHHGEIIFKVGKYKPKEIKNRVIHLLSCLTAQELGPDFVSKGCKAYFGYSEPFVFYPAYSDTFFECDSVIDIEFAKGKLAEEVADSTVERYKVKIDDLENRGNFYIASVLEEDLDNLMGPHIDAMYGVIDATI